MNYLTKDKILGEDFYERMIRFALIEENANGNWDLSDRDENAIRTAHALIMDQRQKLQGLREALDGVMNLALATISIHPKERDNAHEYLKRVIEETKEYLEELDSQEPQSR